MCGILGYFGEVDKVKFISALNLMDHRGPDDWGYLEVERNKHFGHRRLSIIDLNKSANQPMINATKDLVCIYNGEIYNYLEIRDELITKGYTFNTNCDTEVLLNGYHYYGAEILDRVNGMFAFAIYDYRDRSTIIARDRLGIKPLYYTSIDGCFCFASEIKSILALEDKQRELNLESVNSYLYHRYPVLEETFFKGINRLAPGHYIYIENGNVTNRKYWSLSKNVSIPEDQRDEKYYIEKLNDLLISSVKKRMIADVPIGAYLSGGVDSSAVVAHMSRLSSTPIKTFTIGFEEEGYNEFKYANIVSKRYNTEHHEINLSSSNYLDSLENLIFLKDAPLGIPNEVPLYRMSQQLKKYITVVLSGEGADEIFGGYGRIFRSALDFEYLKMLYSGKKITKVLKNKLVEKYGESKFNNELEHFLYLYRYTSTSLRDNILSNRFSEDTVGEKTNKRFEEVFSEVENLPYESKMMYAFEKLHLPGLLQRVDSNTMGAGVEARVPFVDHELVEFAFQIPLDLKLKWVSNKSDIANLLSHEISELHDIPKYILKKSQEEYLSEEILYRKKMGFPVPLDKWLGGDFYSFLKSKLMSGKLVEYELIDKTYVNSILKKENLKASHSLSMTFWMLLNLEIFLEKYF